MIGTGAAVEMYRSDDDCCSLIYVLVVARLQVVFGLGRVFGFACSTRCVAGTGYVLVSSLSEAGTPLRLAQVEPACRACRL